MLPNAVSYNNKIYNTVGMIKMNDGAFLVAQNEKEIIYFDFTRISSLISNINFAVKKPTQVENIFMNLIVQSIQNELNEGNINKKNLVETIRDINKHINTNKSLLISLHDLSNTEPSEAMSILKSNIASIPSLKKDDFPEYDEEVVTAILSKPQGEGFDLDKFIDKYLNFFNIKQIELLGANFTLKPQQAVAINERLLNIKKEKISFQKPDVQSKKRKLTLFGDKSKKAAFIDTLLLSFTVGIFCGVILLYFVLTIMS